MKLAAKLLSLLFIVMFLNGCSNVSVKIPSEMDKVISGYILDRNKDDYAETDKQFEAHKIYGTGKKSHDVIEVYMYSLYEGFNFQTKREVQSGGSLPVFMKLKKSGETYKVIDYKEPRDGAMFESSLKKMFPRQYVKRAIKDTGNVEDLQKQIDRKVSKWLRTTQHGQ
ncbi:hypothetical protein ACFO4N_12225 [Camelliibacillus cellulosilyticus]|uniref:Uncharacterized protein n=1 Tax=Camelliibacillus cellulosilyticus TaxID=2174486 RepID=A0ABV9GPG6_9BACL